MSKIEFTRNHSDLSTNQGFQFEFFCDRCGTGYRTRFQPSVLGNVSSALDAANSLFGGMFGQAANLSQQARSVTWEKAHDDAFTKAMEEIKSDFIQCPHCSAWVCRKSCWNGSKGLCKECAPDVGVEMAAAQASRTREEVWTKSKVAQSEQEMLKDENWQTVVRATCPNCNSPLSGQVKFCPECGTRILSQQTCRQCGAQLKPAAKFCSECGAKV